MQIASQSFKMRNLPSLQNYFKGCNLWYPKNIMIANTNRSFFRLGLAAGKKPGCAQPCPCPDHNAALLRVRLACVQFRQQTAARQPSLICNGNFSAVLWLSYNGAGVWSGIKCIETSSGLQTPGRITYYHAICTINKSSGHIVFWIL